jgi:hypothetical protein
MRQNADQSVPFTIGNKVGGSSHFWRCLAEESGAIEPPQQPMTVCSATDWGVERRRCFQPPGGT